MLKDYFIFNGVDSRTCGLRLQAPITFSGAQPKFETVTIPGRNGDLHYFENAYSNVTGTASCFALAPDVDRTLAQINNWVGGAVGYKRLEVSSEPDVYRMAAVTVGPVTEIRARLLAPFQISFDCMPQKFMKAGEESIEVTTSGTRLYNPWLASKPLVTVTCTKSGGSGKVNIGGTVVSITSTSPEMVIDCDTMNVYYNSTNLNGNISADIFPELANGENVVSWDGDVSKIEIVPRWWTL